MTPLLDGRCALVTGGARGIGLAVARGLSEHGARVVLADLGGAEEAAATLPGPARGIALDVTSEEGTEAAFDALGAEGWAPDVAVANAGILHLESVDTFPAARWEAVMRVNLTGAFLTARAAARRFGAGGRIVLTSSLFGLRGGRAERGLRGLQVRHGGAHAEHGRRPSRRAGSPSTRSRRARSRRR
jgi:NAD(P)-dependent dehydrogenase (short-subunit alcohol dehydrogenase family)